MNLISGRGLCEATWYENIYRDASLLRRMRAWKVQFVETPFDERTFSRFEQHRFKNTAHKPSTPKRGGAPFCGWRNPTRCRLPSSCGVVIVRITEQKPTGITTLGEGQQLAPQMVYKHSRRLDELRGAYRKRLRCDFLLGNAEEGAEANESNTPPGLQRIGRSNNVTYAPEHFKLWARVVFISIKLRAS